MDVNSEGCDMSKWARSCVLLEPQVGDGPESDPSQPKTTKRGRCCWLAWPRPWLPKLAMYGSMRVGSVDRCIKCTIKAHAQQEAGVHRAAARAVQSTASVDQPTVPTGGSSSSSGRRRMKPRCLPSIKFWRDSNLVGRGATEQRAMGTQNVHHALGEATNS